MPRMPDHEMTKPLPTVGRSIGRGGLNPNRRSRHLTMALKDMCHAMRTTMTVSRTAPATAKYAPSVRGFETVENRSNLQADEDEGEDVQREHRRLPDRVCRDACAGRSSRRRSLRHRDGIAHHRQHRRKPETLRQHPDAERRDELKNDRSRDVLHATQPSKGQPSERGACHHAAGDREEEHRDNGGEREAVRGDGTHGQAVDQECARVVQQALAFKDRQEAMGRSQRSQHCRCSNGIRRCDDGSQRNRWRPRHRRDDRAGDDGDGDGGESDRADDEARDWRPVVLEIPQ